MDPKTATCPNPDCPLHGQTGGDTIAIHSKKENRFRCRNCRGTFAAPRGTIFYRRRYDEATITCVITLLAYGCPVQAICRAFALDERTVTAWHEAASRHCQRLHEQVIESSEMDLKHVPQARTSSTYKPMSCASRRRATSSGWRSRSA